MTQVTTPLRAPAPAGYPHPPVPGPAGPAGILGSGRRPPAVNQRRVALRASFEGTPGQLRLLGITAVLSCLVLSLVGFGAFTARANALASARADAAQLIRVQEIATQLVAADSLFTNGYLADGFESATNLAAYDEAIREASSLIAEAAAAKPADARALAAVNDGLTEYTARVASARANNIHAYQVSTGYLRQANVLLRGDGGTGQVKGMLPALQTLMTNSADRVDAAYDDSRLATWLLAVTVLVTVGGLVIVQIRLARRTHRYLNIPLVTSTVVALLVLGVGAVVMMSAQARADDVRDTSYRALQNVARARIEAYTAKSAESITLIYLGTGGGHAAAQKQFQESTREASERLKEVAAASRGTAGRAELAAWQAKHAAVLKLAASDYRSAAKEATKNASDPASLNGSFAALERATDSVLEAHASSVDRGLLAGRGPLLVLSWLAILAGLVAAVSSWAGIAQRLEEYR